MGLKALLEKPQSFPVVIQIFVFQSIKPQLQLRPQLQKFLSQRRKGAKLSSPDSNLRVSTRQTSTSTSSSTSKVSLAKDAKAQSFPVLIQIFVFQPVKPQLQLRPQLQRFLSQRRKAAKLSSRDSKLRVSTHQTSTSTSSSSSSSTKRFLSQRRKGAKLSSPDSNLRVSTRQTSSSSQSRPQRF